MLVDKQGVTIEMPQLPQFNFLFCLELGRGNELDYLEFEPSSLTWVLSVDGWSWCEPGLWFSNLFFLVLPYFANIWACNLFSASLTLIPGSSSPSPGSSRLKTGISTKWKKNQTSVVRVQSLGSSFRNLFCSFSRSGSKNLSNSSFFIVSAKCRLGKGSNLFQVKVNQGPPTPQKICCARWVLFSGKTHLVAPPASVLVVVGCYQSLGWFDQRRRRRRRRKEFFSPENVKIWTFLDCPAAAWTFNIPIFFTVLSKFVKTHKNFHQKISASSKELLSVALDTRPLCQGSQTMLQSGKPPVKKVWSREFFKRWPSTLFQIVALVVNKDDESSAKVERSERGSQDHRFASRSFNSERRYD